MLHAKVLEDLEEIRAFLAIHSESAADFAITKIFSIIREVIVPFPKSGHRRVDLTTRPVRFSIVLGRYLIVYAPAQEPLLIVAVVDGRVNPRVIASILRGRE